VQRRGPLPDQDEADGRRARREDPDDYRRAGGAPLGGARRRRERDDFFLRPESAMVTGQVVYLGGVG
jgi:hypothetical protein